MASASYIIGALGDNMVFGCADADTISSEDTQEYTKEVQAVNGFGAVVALALSAPIQSVRSEKYGTSTPEEIGVSNNIRVTIRRSNEDFARVSVEQKFLMA